MIPRLIYLTHDGLVEMVLSGERFIIRDAATGEDVTRTILDALH
jgi:polyhydroxyalkanoate synthesis regulator protein